MTFQEKIAKRNAAWMLTFITEPLHSIRDATECYILTGSRNVWTAINQLRRKVLFYFFSELLPLMSGSLSVGGAFSNRSFWRANKVIYFSEAIFDVHLWGKNSQAGGWVHFPVGKQKQRASLYWCETFTHSHLINLLNHLKNMVIDCSFSMLGTPNFQPNYSGFVTFVMQSLVFFYLYLFFKWLLLRRLVHLPLVAALVVYFYWSWKGLFFKNFRLNFCPQQLRRPFKLTYRLFRKLFFLILHISSAQTFMGSHQYTGKKISAWFTPSFLPLHLTVYGSIPTWLLPSKIVANFQIYPASRETSIPTSISFPKY